MTITEDRYIDAKGRVVYAAITAQEAGMDLPAPLTAAIRSFLAAERAYDEERDAARSERAS